MQKSKWPPWNSILWALKNEGSMFGYFDSTCRQWNKSLESLRKAGKKQTKTKKMKGNLRNLCWKSPERWENNKNRWSKYSVTCVLLSRSFVPRLAKRCQGNCGINLMFSDNEDYLVVKSHGSTTLTVNGEETTKSGPQDVHFITCVWKNMRT